MTEPEDDSENGEEQTDEQEVLRGRPPEEEREDADPPDWVDDDEVCSGCGRHVTLMGNGYCGRCQDQAGDDDA